MTTNAVTKTSSGLLSIIYLINGINLLLIGRLIPIFSLLKKLDNGLPEEYTRGYINKGHTKNVN